MAGFLFPQAGFAELAKSPGGSGFRPFRPMAAARAAMRRSANRRLVA
jgi:hypothetical protein